MVVPLFDPLQAPIASISGDPALDAATLTPERLRNSFLRPRPWQLEPTEEPRFRASGVEPRVAAVLIPIVMHRAGLTVLFTERTAHLSAHAGQVSFPGGRAELLDANLVDTALREAEEEVGLRRSQVEPIGELPDYFTGTGYQVRPVVALVTPGFDLVCDSAEVDEVFEVPLAFLMDPSNLETRRMELPGGVRTFFAIPFGTHIIWGATAAMVRNFYRFLAVQLAP